MWLAFSNSLAQLGQLNAILEISKERQLSPNYQDVPTYLYIYGYINDAVVRSNYTASNVD
jgi:hypothetical protein